MILKHHMTTKNLENGRSMVEMLGTLAIIGVLSIGGIAGYSYGMDKHKANQTINDIMLMGVDMITQTSQKRGVPTLTEWGTKTSVGYNFTVTSNPDNNSQYGIQITGVPSRVCQMVGDGLQERVAVYVGNEDYSSDTESDPCNSSEENTMSFFFEPVETAFGECKTDTDCGDGRYCDKDTGFCFWDGKPEGTRGACDTSDSCCSNGDPYPKHGEKCTINTRNDGMCYYGTCLVKGCTYDENKCEGFGVYCASPNDNCMEAFLTPQSTGTCVKADFAKLNVAGKTYYVSYKHISWWDADAACKALGRDGLIGVSDLVNGWNGGVDPYSHEFTALGAALQSYLGTDFYVWTSDDSNADYDGCLALVVYLNLGLVGHSARDNYNDGLFAVCR